MHRLFETCFIPILVAVVLFAVNPTLSSAQDGILDVHGTVKNDATRKNMDGVTVKVLQNGKEYDSFTTTGNGKYAFNLPLGHNYMLTFSAEQFINKKIEINTKGIPPEDMAGGFKLNMDMTLFSFIEGFDLKIMDKPLGKASFDPIRNSVEFDYDYTARMQKEIADELKRLQKMEKEMEKLLKEFNDLVAKGDQAMSAKKYSEAVSKYEAALKVIPNRDPAPAKLAEAQAALDAENAAKELEQRYLSLMNQAKGDIGKKKYAEARDALTEASNLKPDEREPKDLLATIQKELEALEKRAQYEGVIALADKEFDAGNYAVSIKKYEEALDLFPNENHPRDRIKAARKFIDEQLAAAAEEEERNRRYNDAMAAGDRNVGEKNYDSAINKYREALNIKPGEKLPKDKIAEVEGLIAKAAKAEKDALAKAEQSERDRIEKEYRDMVKRADDKFKGKKLQSARDDYLLALQIKPDESYPQTRIERIDELLAEEQERSAREREATDAASRAEEEYRAIIAAADAKFDAGDLEAARLDYEGALLVKPNDKYPSTRITRINEMLAKQAGAEQERLAEEQRLREEQERLAREEQERIEREQRLADQDASRLRRQQQEEEERARLAAERQRKADEERERLSAFANNVDATSEDEAERYYREARRRDELAKQDRINDEKNQLSSLLVNRELDALDVRARRSEERLAVEETMTRIYRDGEMNRELKVNDTEIVKEKTSAREADAAQRASFRRQTEMAKTEQKHSAMSMVAEKDALRQTQIAHVENLHQEHTLTQAAYASKGDARRTNNEFEVERHNDLMANMARDGEIIRQDNVVRKEDEKLLVSSYATDLTRAADERRTIGSERVIEQKQTLSKVGAGKEDQTADNAQAVKRQKEQLSDFQSERVAAAEERAFNKRRELFDKDAGAPKSDDDYRLPPGYEDLEEGVQEKSYEEGNKMIIERTVRRGNKVDTYRKVISKTGIYYFKNGTSITEGLWKRETLLVQN